MREIKFRAMELPSDYVLGRGYKPKMVYGTGFLKDPVNTWLVVNDETQPIAFGESHKVINPKTVGQFTGLHDKNGKEIYEGDILRSPVLLSGEMINMPVRWIDCGFIANGLLGTREAENSEVLGNIHENPEVLNVDC